LIYSKYFYYYHALRFEKCFILFIKEKMKTKKNPILQAIFFDFDGVIVDSSATKTEAFRTLFGNYDSEIIEEAVAYHRLHGGISRIEKIRYVHQEILKFPLAEKDLAVWAERYSKLVVDKVIDADWIAGAKEFLDDIPGMLPVFLISGTPEKELKYIVEQREMTSCFQEVLGSPTRKPNHIRCILSKYRLNPEQCVFVGDALTDFSAAQETGLSFVGIQGEINFPSGTCVLPDCRGLREAIEKDFIWQTSTRSLSLNGEANE
jgi:HAD superfamily hydrolase (TIGR01549 family)